MQDIDSPYLTPREASDYLKVGRTTLDRWAERGCGPRRYGRGRIIRYRRDELDQWLANEVRA